MTITVRVLGPFEVEVDGSPIILGGGRQRSVLALLVLSRDRSLTAEALADRLWSDEPPDAAIKTIQAYVSRLRQSLGTEAERLTSGPGGYRFRLDQADLDAARFEVLLSRARTELAVTPETRAGTARATLDEALDLWRGPVLSDLRDLPFAVREARSAGATPPGGRRAQVRGSVRRRR